ncbi:hypothetical protein HZH66_011740 [Vespula vulgaris]|uniref:Uncharacterized protein n=1 Tax=Vespula vulgaris TaxID=7454 RepID=A0A834JCY4_VESVU|nr:hypothetical protein HZH66_011740 [Vespula vulgaris]
MSHTTLPISKRRVSREGGLEKKRVGSKGLTFAQDDAFAGSLDSVGLFTDTCVYSGLDEVRDQTATRGSTKFAEGKYGEGVERSSNDARDKNGNRNP